MVGGGERSTNELLVGLLEEDGVVGLVMLAMHCNCAFHCADCNRKRWFSAYRHLGGMLLVLLWCVELSWGSSAVMAQLHDVRYACRAEPRGSTG